MSYIQITSKCNFHCKHCGMNAKAKGEDMSLETFRKAIEVIGDSVITLGGGEPTIHPKFWEIMGIALGHPYIESIWLATNGSQTETTLALAKLAEKEVIGCALSLDPFHDPIDQHVINTWKRLDLDIRDTSRHLIKAGRATRLKDWDTEKGCICEDIFIKPNGDIMRCGCKDATKLGNVYTPFEMPSEWEMNTCSHNIKKKLLDITTE